MSTVLVAAVLAGAVSNIVAALRISALERRVAALSDEAAS